MSFLIREEQVPRCLQQIRTKLLSEGVYDVAINHAHDTGAADRVRDKAIELILELQKTTK